MIENLRQHSDEEKMFYAVFVAAVFLLAFGSFWVKYSLDHRFNNLATEFEQKNTARQESQSENQKASAADPFSKTFFEVKSKVKSINKEDDKKDGIKPIKIEI